MNPFRKIIRKIGLLFNANVIASKLISPITKKVKTLFTFKTKSVEDYYTVGNFLISKKIVFTVILVGCASVFIYFEMFAEPVSDTVSLTNVVTTVYYDYDDLDLEEYTGKANIVADNGEVVYTGDIVSGYCTGTGTLWTQDGVLVYEGQFSNNELSGEGTYYYSDGMIRYVGEFKKNVFEGNGISYYRDGRVEYEGAFQNGNYHGTGTLYNEDENMIYVGEFLNGTYHGEGISYYDNGIKQYEGEFYMGNEQGEGTSYSTMGKRLFTGQFARGNIYYESLFGYSLAELSVMFGETPVIYYTSEDVCYTYEGAQVAIQLDCSIASKIEETSSGNSGDGWYLPEDSDELLEEVNIDTQVIEFPGEEGEDAKQVTLPIMSTADKYTYYYYLSSNEWQLEADLDQSQVWVSKVIAFDEDIDLALIDDVDPISTASGATLAECVAIENLRERMPTIFSQIAFEEKSQNQNYYYVSNINQSASIYMELFEVENIRYKKCFENDDPLNMSFLILEQY